ncbi:MAG: DUF1028 domain-containing protein [Gammaproteobacteria bacterium]|nr:DUF1028 domain-containing protein [Gammaproteobacteria bacterium]
MTYSIVARDPASGQVGIAVASRFFAVGCMVPSISYGIGAVCSQAFVNPHYSAKALALLQNDEQPSDVIKRLTDEDEGRLQRQLHMLDYHGRSAAYTGVNCIEWAGHEIADNVSVAGNMLSGPAVVADTLTTYQSTSGLPLPERLLMAMQAGEDAGGDKRGKQSAALLVYKDQTYPWIDIRTDDHADPLEELRRLYDVAQERYLIMLDMLPSRDNPHGLIDRREIDQKLQSLELDRLSKGIKTRSFATPLS